MITLALFSVVLIAFLAVDRPAARRRWRSALYLWYQLHFFAIVTGFSLAASVLFMRYRDLNQVWEVVTQAGFFVAPIIYPIGVLPERMHVYLYLWPPTPIILFSRSVLVDGSVPVAAGARAADAGGGGRSWSSGALIYRRARAARRGVSLMAPVIEVDGVSKASRFRRVRRDTVREHALDFFRRAAQGAAAACSTRSASSCGAARASA